MFINANNTQSTNHTIFVDKSSTIDVKWTALIFWYFYHSNNFTTCEHSPIHTNCYTLTAHLLTRKTHTLTHRWDSHQEQFWVECLAQWHFLMQTGEVGDCTIELPISGWPPELQCSLEGNNFLQTWPCVTLCVVVLRRFREKCRNLYHSLVWSWM